MNVSLHTARVIETRFVPPGSSGWTFGHRIMIRPGLSPEKKARLLRHERAHVRQYEEFGVLGFLSRYLWAYVKNLIRYRRHRVAYLSIPFEVEARRLSR